MKRRILLLSGASLGRYRSKENIMLAGRLACSLVSLIACVAACTPGSSGPTEKTAHSATPPAPSASSAAATTAPVLVPGESIGPVRIGMTRADLDALGLPTKKGPMSTDVTVGPYVASFDGDRVGGVSVALRELPGGARVGGAVFDGSAKIQAIAAQLRGCGPTHENTGASVILCENARALVIGGGPPQLPSIEVVSAERAQKLLAKSGDAPAPTSEATWKHPGMAMSFTYPDKLLEVRQKPDGATLKTEIIGTIEDRSGHGKDRPSPFQMTISVRVGPLLDVMKSSGAVPVSTLFPGGNEQSFKEEKDSAERLTVNGSQGYRISSGSHDIFEDRVYASLGPRSTLEVICAYVGDMAKPKVDFGTQREACGRVLATLSIKP
ncbi:Hypothetical protein A7982_10138 [Minicystis rosea]|nr:Hypothetical protein A7982_10138 [Minicystis rosea]